MKTIKEPEAIDRLLGSYFKAQLKHPWPTAPVLHQEPSILATHPITRITHHSSRPRRTLAASVAVFVGLCWYFSHGSNPATPGGPSPSGNTAGPMILPNSTAGSSSGDILDEMKEIKAKQPPIVDPFGN